MANVFRKVRPVEGHMIVDPRTIGGAENRRIGYERVIDGTVFVGGAEQPRVRHRFVGGEHVVMETTDLFLRRAILDGSLDYVETVHDHGTPRERAFREVDLVRATVRNQQARAAEATAKAKELAEAKEAEAKELAELDALLEPPPAPKAAEPAEPAEPAEFVKAEAAPSDAPSPTLPALELAENHADAATR